MYMYVTRVFPRVLVNSDMTSTSKVTLLCRKRLVEEYKKSYQMIVTMRRRIIS